MCATVESRNLVFCSVSRPIRIKNISSRPTGRPSRRGPVRGDIMSDPVFTFDDGHGFVVNVYAEEVDGGVKFTVETVSGVGDINGFFLDLGSDGGSIKSVGSNAN